MGYLILFFILTSPLVFWLYHITFKEYDKYKGEF